MKEGSWDGDSELKRKGSQAACLPAVWRGHLGVLRVVRGCRNRFEVSLCLRVAVSYTVASPFWIRSRVICSAWNFVTMQFRASMLIRRPSLYLGYRNSVHKYIDDCDVFLLIPVSKTYPTIRLYVFKNATIYFSTLMNWLVTYELFLGVYPMKFDISPLRPLCTNYCVGYAWHHIRALYVLITIWIGFTVSHVRDLLRTSISVYSYVVEMFSFSVHLFFFFFIMLDAWSRFDALFPKNIRCRSNDIIVLFPKPSANGSLFSCFILRSMDELCRGGFFRCNIILFFLPIKRYRRSDGKIVFIILN